VTQACGALCKRLEVLAGRVVWSTMRYVREPHQSLDLYAQLIPASVIGVK